MSKDLNKRLAALEKEMNALKVEIKKEEKKTAKKPKKIDDCDTIDQVKKFTVTELKAWIKKNKIDVKKIEEKYKDDFVKIVWKNIKEYSSDNSSDYSSSEDEEEEDVDGWEYY